jgi:hypothetical protein
MARPKKTEGLGAKLAAGFKKIMGGEKQAEKPKAKSPAKAKSPKVSLKAKVKPRDLNRVEKKGKIAKFLSAKGEKTQTARGKKQDKKFIALPAGKRIATKVATITKADGTTFKRRNPRAVAGNIYSEKRKNRADVFGKVARRGGRM